MKKLLTSLSCALFVIIGLSALNGQRAYGQYLSSTDSIFKSGAPMTGHIWGYVFGDYYYKAHSDALDRGGSNQFTGIQKNANAFDLRRAYLGYDFHINSKFSTHFLLAAEDWSPNSKFSFYLKQANFQWKNIFKRSTLIVGLSNTPSYVNYSTRIWGYRSIEKTISGMEGVPSYDLGVALKGTFDAAGNFGYHIMIGNGAGAKALDSRFKRFYGDVYGLFLNKKLMVNLYADYSRMDWQQGFHHSENITKLFVAYQQKKFTVGAEAFYRHGQNDVVTADLAGVDTVNGNALGLSVFVRGRLIDKKLGYFARTDFVNPYLNYDNNKIYTGLSSHFNPNTKQQFVVLGLDYSPAKNIHLMPNIWYCNYRGQGAHLSDAAKSDYDLAYRITFYFIFGK